MDGKKLEYKGEEALKELEKLTLKVDDVQENILKLIITRNGDTEYLNKYMKGSKDVSCFKSRVPIITYEGIRPYIQRIANGEDSSLLTGHTITEMLCSSGTSNGEPKLMPSISEDLDRRTFVYNLIMPIVNQYIPGLGEGKAMYLYFVKAEMSTPCGLPARTVLTSYYRSKHFKGRARNTPFNEFTSPDQAILCEDSNQSMYCQLLAGLVQRHQVVRLGAVFASAFLRCITFLEKNWVKLWNDIRKGKLDLSITDPECRLAMSNILVSPNPSLADELEEICRSSLWKGILCKLWPKAKYIEAVVTGSMAQYIPSLEYYSDGKLPLVCPMYAASECYLGVNLKPLCDPSEISYTLLPNMAYFEFIQLGKDAWSVNAGEEKEVPRDKIVDLARVRLGYFYELVVTTFAGLYRYRIGDVLQVTGFHNKAPQFRFICRKNVILSLDNDKTSEEDLHKSITVAKKLLEPHNALLLEYTSYPDASTTPGHYVLYWEIRYVQEASSPLNEVLRECCITIEEELDYIYRRCRSYDKCIGPLEIRVVKPGTFEALMDFYISQGASINQYKTPRCVTSNTALKLLEANVKECFFSPRAPMWSP